MDLAIIPGDRDSSPEDYAQNVHRTLPADSGAEAGVLCSIFLRPLESLDECQLRITPEHFHNPGHRLIYQSCLDLAAQNQPVDLITLSTKLYAAQTLSAAGGAAYLAEIQTVIPTAANLNYYLEILREKFLLRESIRIGTRMVQDGYDRQDEVDEQLAEAEKAITDLSAGRFRTQDVGMKELVMDAIDRIELLYDRRGALTGLATGFVDLDRLTGGLQDSDLVIIAGRPSSGKSALGMNIVEHVGCELGLPVGVFSAEMSKQSLVQRLLCSRAHVNLQRVRDGFLSERDFPNLTHAAGDLRESTILIDDTSSIKINELRAKARRWKARHGIRLLLVDYLQLLKGSSKRGEGDRRLEVEEISAGLKALAKDLNIPVIALAQLNRNPEQRKDGRPRVADLREAGGIEQDADVIGLLHRPEMYADEEDKAESVGKAELIVAKQRNGPTDSVSLTFLKQYTRFENFTPGNN